ncbi:Temperature shock-inducible protein 1 [Pichia kudriavzevii]|uniref:Temperature shock-inducible protein 1 n=1 Tax=Pichia kudriavzevii TaxID=4909 RepID=A0A099NV24_PICKU|nr:hypothetical protein JL09_g5085 [Pichia kudriavzevii]ONH72342.1 Temperature shock-inducible protein 1 [Pichia kudriavzevii]
MQLSLSVILSIATLLATTKAEDSEKVLEHDLKHHKSEYVSYVEAHTELESAFSRIDTYTDDSFTTILDLSSFVVNLPWYSSRLESKLEKSEPKTSEDSDHHAKSKTSKGGASYLEPGAGLLALAAMVLL